MAVPDYSVSQTYTGPTFPHTVTLPTHTTTGSSPPITLTSPADLALFTQSAPSDTLIKLPIIGPGAFELHVEHAATAAGARRSAPGWSPRSRTPTSRPPVPEPSTLAAFGLGIGGYLLARRNRRSASAA